MPRATLSLAVTFFTKVTAPTTSCVEYLAVTSPGGGGGLLLLNLHGRSPMATADFH